MDLLKNSNNISFNFKNTFINDFSKSLENFLNSNNYSERNINMIETLIIDRIEGDSNKYAVCELSDNSFINIPISKFNFPIQSSDIIKANITYLNGKINNIKILSKDNSLKKMREDNINEKFKNLKN